MDKQRTEQTKKSRRRCHGSKLPWFHTGTRQCRGCTFSSFVKACDNYHDRFRKLTPGNRAITFSRWRPDFRPNNGPHGQKAYYSTRYSIQDLIQDLSISPTMGSKNVHKENTKKVSTKRKSVPKLNYKDRGKKRECIICRTS